MSSTDRFGYEWSKYHEIDPNYEIQFSRWVKPLRPEDFKGKTVLDAGCGMGRNSYWALNWGARKVLAFDYDERSVQAAERNLQEYGDRVHVVYKSIYELPWKNEFDLVFCIGVIHHLENPKLAIENLVKALKPGGRLLLWVYSYEGNEWIVKLVNPIRQHLTSRLPLLLVHFLSYFASVPIYLFIKLFKGPGEYLHQLSQFRLAHVHSIVFDQLIPKIANYWTRQEALSLLKLPELKNLQIGRPDSGQGWTVLAMKNDLPKSF